jgi:hypothetical protein
VGLPGGGSFWTSVGVYGWWHLIPGLASWWVWGGAYGSVVRVRSDEIEKK